MFMVNITVNMATLCVLYNCDFVKDRLGDIAELLSWFGQNKKPLQ